MQNGRCFDINTFGQAPICFSLKKPTAHIQNIDNYIENYFSSYFLSSQNRFTIKFRIKPFLVYGGLNK